MEQEKKISTQHTESETTESAVENQETTAVTADSQQDAVDSGKNQSQKHDKKHRQGKSKKAKIQISSRFTSGRVLNILHCLPCWWLSLSFVWWA